MQDLGQDISVLEGLTKGRPVPALGNPTLPEIAPAGRGINAMAAALVIGAVMLPSLLLGGKLDEVGPIAARSKIEAKLPATRPLQTDPLRAMEHIAQAELPRPIVLALIAPLPLQDLQIAGREVRVAGEQTQIVSAREGIQPAAKTNLASKINASAKLGAPKAVATQKQLSGASNSPRLTARPAARSIAERKPSPSLPDLAGRSVNDLSPEQISRALFDIAERAGLVEESQSGAFQACVLEKIGGKGAEAELFWSLVRLCVR